MFFAPRAAGITKPTNRKVTNAKGKRNFMTKLNAISAVSKAPTRTVLTTAARITLMTDITELALMLKLELHRAVSNFNPQMNVKTRDLKELVEALEKAQRANNSAPAILRQLAEEKQKRGEVAAATAFNYAASALQKELSK